MKITSIKQQIKNPDRASLFVDGKYSFSLTLSELVVEKLKINQGIDDIELKRLKKLSDEGKLRARALEWVLNRPRSVREFNDYLYRKKAEPDQIKALCVDFEDKGYLSDTKFAVWLIEMRRRGGKSDRSIGNELMKKGVSRYIISKTLIKDQEQELVMLKQLVDKKLKLSRYKNDEIKLKQLLLRQGFSYDDIKRVLSDKYLS